MPISLLFQTDKGCALIPDWEKNVKFDPLGAVCQKRSGEKLVKLECTASDPHSSHKATDAECVALTDSDFSLSDLRFRDESYFISNNLRNYSDEWESISQCTPGGAKVCNWIKEGINVHDFFKSFKGMYKGNYYCSDTPPPAYFANSPVCKNWVGFVSETLEERLQNGSMKLIGRVGDVAPPHIVMPLTVEPSKPRLCHDERFLNLWIKESPVKLDTLREVPRVVNKGGFLASVDDKSSYDHVGLGETSQTYFGVQWGGWYMCYTTLPFGFKASAYIYQSIGLLPISYIRQLDVPALLYIDDRLIPPFIGQGSGTRSLKDNARRAIYIVCSVLLRLGYFLSLRKSVLDPCTRLKWLGMIANCDLLAFQISDDKKKSFATLRELILSNEICPLVLLQRFVGKCVSFILAVPGAKLYTREANRAISRAERSGKPVCMYPDLIGEIRCWRFLDEWSGYLPWREERHVQVVMATDSSRYKWGAVIYQKTEGPVEFGDLWVGDDDRPIHLKEAEGLLKALKSVTDATKNCRVDAFVDNMAVLHAWENEGVRNRELTEVIKLIFLHIQANNISLRLHYVPSASNPADFPSRAISKFDATLTAEVWFRVENLFGPHGFDLMAIDSNAMRDRHGNSLPHFTPYPSPNSSGVNVFSQSIDKSVNVYVFPPFHLISALLSFLGNVTGLWCTMIIPLQDITPPWWPFCKSKTVAAHTLGRKGDKSVLLIPTKKGFVADQYGLQFDLLAVRLRF